MATLNEDLLAVSLEGFDRSSVAPAGSEEVLSYSEEGIKGAVLGFLLGTGTYLLPLASGAVNATMKDKRVKLKNEINQIAKKIAQIQKGDYEAAKKEGREIDIKDVKGAAAADVIKSAVLGIFLSPIYTSYQMHMAEELNKELASKMAELQMAMSEAAMQK